MNREQTHNGEEQAGAPLQVDAALGDPWDRLGAAIERAGVEDSSGFRRHLARSLYCRQFFFVARWLNITTTEAEELRAAFVTAYGE